MKPELVIFTANHHFVQLDKREGLSQAIDNSLREQLQKLSFVNGVVLVETCNRIELIFSIENPKELKRLDDKLREVFSTDERSLEHFSRLIGDQAVRHLFRVVSGLDSQVVGEAQIAGQIKRSYYQALKSECTDTFLNRAFHRAFYVSKKVRTESQIGRGSVSIASLATKLAEQVVGDIADRRVLVIGAGELAEITLKNLHQKGLKDLSVVNRTAEKSFLLAKKFGGKSFSWENLKEEIEVSDVVISTVQGQFRIRQEHFPEKALSDAKCVIDLSFPRSVHPAVSDIEGVYLYSLEDLQQLSQRNLNERLESGKLAEELIEEEVWRFLEDDSHHELGEFSRWVDSEIVKEEARIRRNLIRQGVGAEALLTLSQELAQSFRSLASRLIHDRRAEIRSKLRKGR